MKLTLDLTQDELVTMRAALMFCIKHERDESITITLVKIFGKVEASESTSRTGAAVASPTKGDDAT